ncbi:MAG: AMP-binding protein [Parachlamydiales bacterium]|nr:AMP-binding protein [Parachlamydiales bacterium]
MPCPLREAAADAPNQIAILSKDYSLTYAELDRLVDEVPIVKMFSAWRKGLSYFTTNPRFPMPSIEGPPKTLLLYTSGSTGTPKAAILSMDNLLANAKSAIPALDLKPGDQWKLSLPLYHVGGIGIVIRCILARATIVLDDSPDITHLSYVPTQLYRSTPIYKKLRCLLLGGAPIVSYPQNLPIYTTYGLTEMASIVALNGKVLPDRELKIEKDQEIWVRGPTLFQGYFGEPPQIGWFPTKDLGAYINGKLEILGRKDWMFISGGENIQPEEIEKHLLAFPEVVEAAVVPIDDPEWGKRPVAVLAARKTFSLQEMQARLREHLPKFKIPIALYFLDELPKKNNLKLNRFFLAQFIKDQADRNMSVQKNGPYL